MSCLGHDQGMNASCIQFTSVQTRPDMFRQAHQHKRCNAYIGQWCRVILFDFIITSAQGKKKKKRKKPRKSWSLCCFITPGLSKDIQCGIRVKGKKRGKGEGGGAACNY